MRKVLVLGPPGTGKTERLLTEMEKCLEKGISPSHIAFVSYTRAAVREARERASVKFGIDQDDFPLFRTLHSLCFHELGLRRSEVFGRESLKKLEELTGDKLSGHVDLTAPTIGNTGDACLFLDQYARNTLTPLRDVWGKLEIGVNWWRLLRFVQAYEEFRRDRLEVDFTDMLERYVNGTPAYPTEARVAFIDEAQDLTPLQWRVVKRAFANVDELWVAGDDDQAIFTWAGADPDTLLAWDGEKNVLTQSYRLPQLVFNTAMRVTQDIRNRYEKVFLPTGETGVVERVRNLNHVDLSAAGTWLLLARTRRQLAELVKLARAQGVMYTVMGSPSIDADTVEAVRDHERVRRERPELPIWHAALTDIPPDDREYMVSCLRRGESLTAPPRVRIETIHGAKGAQADSVLLLTDLSRRIRRSMRLNSDAERRVQYVACTRARANFYYTPGRSALKGYVF